MQGEKVFLSTAICLPMVNLREWLMTWRGFLVTVSFASPTESPNSTALIVFVKEVTFSYAYNIRTQTLLCDVMFEKGCQIPCNKA